MHSYFSCTHKMKTIICSRIMEAKEQANIKSENHRSKKKTLWIPDGMGRAEEEYKLRTWSRRPETAFTRSCAVGRETPQSFSEAL